MASDSSECPFCGYMAYNVQQEIFHMNTAHPEKVVERLRFAGLHREADEYEREHGT